MTSQSQLGVQVWGQGFLIPAFPSFLPSTLLPPCGCCGSSPALLLDPRNWVRYLGLRPCCPGQFPWRGQVSSQGNHEGTWQLVSCCKSHLIGHSSHV